MSYRIPMQAYWGYSDAEAIHFFLKYQEGVALSTGEKYHAVNEMSPLVKMTKEMLMTAGVGFHDRAEKVWGRRCDEMNRTGDNITDKGRKWLCSACAVIAGLVWGPSRVNKKWEDISSMLTMPLRGVGETDEKVKERISAGMDLILGIFEEVQTRYPVSALKYKKQFDPGFATGYIIHSISVTPADKIPEMKERWISFLVQERKDDKKGRKPILQSDEVVAACRNWTIARWKNGHDRVFSDAPASALVSAEAEEEDEDEEDEDSE